MDRATASAIEVAAAILNSSSPLRLFVLRRQLTVKTECRTWGLDAAPQTKRNACDIIVNEQLPVTTRQWTQRRLAAISAIWKAWGAQPGAGSPLRRRWRHAGTDE